MAAVNVGKSFPAARVRHPHRGHPDNFTVLLFAAHVIIRRLASRGTGVAPREVHSGFAGRRGVDVLVVLDDMYFREWRRARQFDAERWGLGRGKGIAHDEIGRASGRESV